MSLISRNLHNQMMFNDAIELVDIRWLQQWAAYPPTKMTADALNELMQDLLSNGINDPALLVVNPHTNQIRMDSGNHRVYLLPLLGIVTLPVTAYVTSMDPVLSATNGTHSYITDCITASTDFDADYYAKPSSVVDLHIRQ